jgi:RecB family exonuclease
MICSALNIDRAELYGQNEKYCLALEDIKSDDKQRTVVTYKQQTLKPILFQSDTLKSATSESITTSSDTKAANLGTLTHKIIELYWESFDQNQDLILDKMMVFETSQRKTIIENMNSFYKSDLYQLLKDGVEHYFELAFTFDGKTGFIDLIYFDKKSDGWVIIDFKTGVKSEEKSTNYQKQLDFYRDVVEELGYRVVETRLLWLN